jgi:hypothetical protein
MNVGVVKIETKKHLTFIKKIIKITTLDEYFLTLIF